MPDTPALGDLATPVTVIDAATGVGEIEQRLRSDPETLGLVAVADGTMYVLDRPYLESVLAGRLGYGRALLFRRPARAILRGPALVLPAATAWDDAARAVLERPNAAKADPVVVTFDDGRIGIAPVGPLVEHLSRRYETLAQQDILTGLGNRRRLTRTAGALLDRAIVEAVARMAQGLRLTLVAEGVEDQRTADILRETGFDVLQGYHFGRPVPPGRLASDHAAVA